MNSAAYDAVCSLSMEHKPDYGEVEEEGRGGVGRWRRGVHSVIAAHRLDTQLYGKSWEAMSAEEQQRVLAERRRARVADRREREQAAQRRMSLTDIPELLRRNSETPEVLRTRGVSTDIRQSHSDLTWSKAWYLTTEGSRPILDSAAQYHNRREGGWADQAAFEKIGVAYMKLPRDDLTALNGLVAERNYTEMEQQVLEGKSPALEVLFQEHFNTTEVVVFVQQGTCYYDFRDAQGSYLRMHLSEHDLLIIPAGLLHRAALDQMQHVELMRFHASNFRMVPRDSTKQAPSEYQAVRASYLASRKRNSVLRDNHIIGSTE